MDLRHDVGMNDAKEQPILDSLGDRMKGYERVANHSLMRRVPVIVRVDGRAFHTWTRGLGRPFDTIFMRIMDNVACALCKEMAGTVFAFVQSDEVSVLLHTYKRLATEPWLDNRISKLCSISASVATAAFNDYAKLQWPTRCSAYFDARCFTLPPAEVVNYFLWRQQDATRNSIQMLARSLASHRECHGLNTNQLQELCWQRGKNWNDLPTQCRRGRAANRQQLGNDRTGWVIDNEVPIFKAKGRDYIEQLLAIEDESKPAD